MGTHRRTQQAGEAVTYTVGFDRAIEEIREPGKAYLSGVFVRPPEPTGFEYEATSAGQTSADDEIEWPIVLGGTVQDGSVVWTARVGPPTGQEAVDTISTHSVSSPAGITDDGGTLDGTNVDVALSGGTPGETYLIDIEIITSAGDEYIETIELVVT